MRVVTADEVHGALALPALADAIGAALKSSALAPLRQAYALSTDDTLLTMPAWSANGLGVKIVTVMPGNRVLGKATVAASYLLLDRATGEPRAVIDGEALTIRRTAATSLLAARYLARADVRTVLVIGTGRLAPMMARAHCAERPIDRLLIWGRDPTASERTARELSAEGLPAFATSELDRALSSAGIVSCATTATRPIVQGQWLVPGMHLDLVGAFKRGMREADDAAIARCLIVVDTYAGALAEAGDVIEPIENGTITRSAIVGELAELVEGHVTGRRSESDITLFKSVGTAVADLAAAQLLLDRLT
jgi:ornithine cyclodeaminase/alanine dehydrogenase-like protein (mu-crystallin family)